MNKRSKSATLSAVLDQRGNGSTHKEDLKVALLRYFNPVGAHPSGRIGEEPGGITCNLLPFIVQVAVGRLPRLSVFGNDYPTPDGTALAFPRERARVEGPV